MGFSSLRNAQKLAFGIQRLLLSSDKTGTGKEKRECLNSKCEISDIKLSDFRWKKVIHLAVPVLKNAGQCVMFLEVSHLMRFDPVTRFHDDFI